MKLKQLKDYYNTDTVEFVIKENYELKIFALEEKWIEDNFTIDKNLIQKSLYKTKKS